MARFNRELNNQAVIKKPSFNWLSKNFKLIKRLREFGKKMFRSSIFLSRGKEEDCWIFVSLKYKRTSAVRERRNLMNPLHAKEPKTQLVTFCSEVLTVSPHS